MSERTVDARLDATICTNEDTRSFIKVGMSINGIDPDGDVEAQLAQGLETGRAALRIMNDGIVEEVSNAITVTDNPTILVDQLGDLATRVEKVESVMTRVVIKVRELLKLPSSSEVPTQPEVVEASTEEPVEDPPKAVDKPAKVKKGKTNGNE